MRVSLNLIKKYTDVKLPLPELINKINQQLGGVEEVIDLSERYADALIVRVVSADKHPNADRLTVCLIDDGGKRAGLDRDESGYVQVVCGAPNVEPGMLAVWLPPASVVPASYATDEPFMLVARELRGVVSNGMLAAGDELAINNDHDGIIEITPSDLPSGASFDNLIGAKFADVFGLNDNLIDIENKMFTHRPDLFGQIGIARELFAILQPNLKANQPTDASFSEPDWYINSPEFESASGLELEVFNSVPNRSPRFMAVAVKDVEVRPSPLWLQVELMRLGAKPINNIVDLTNYIMLLTAQPVHAYDYDKLRGRKLGVRLAESGEQVKLLNDKVYQLNENDIVIVDGEGVVGLAGVMGGSDSEVSAATKNIVIEVANFDMYSVRRTSMRHGLFTDAVTRFNKGQSKQQADRVLSRLLQFIPGTQASDVYDLPGQSPEADSEIEVETSFINSRLGLELSSPQVAAILGYVNFSVTLADGNPDRLVVVAPFWRTDIELPEDIVEEVGRLYGFDKLPRELPQRSIKPAAKNPIRELKQRLRESLSRAGANEVLTYSFVHRNVLTAAGQNPDDSYQLGNSLSPDLQYYRQSLTPSLLRSIHPNIKAGYPSFAMFEIGRGHQKSLGLEQAVPAEVDRLALVVAAKKPTAGAAFYLARHYLDYLMTSLRLEVLIEPLESADTAVSAPFELSRSGQVIDSRSGRVIGVIGEYNLSTRKAFKLPEAAAGFELDLAGLQELMAMGGTSYQPLSRYPSLNRDISLRVGDKVSYQAVLDSIKQADLGEVRAEIEPLGIYQSQDDRAFKNITFRIKLTNYSKTMTAADADAAMTAIANRAIDGHQAEVV